MDVLEPYVTSQRGNFQNCVFKQLISGDVTNINLFIYCISDTDIRKHW